VAGIRIFIAHGLQDPVFPIRAAYRNYRHFISERMTCDEGNSLINGGILWVPKGGHFLQEHGQFVAEKAMKYFGDIPFSPVEHEWILTRSEHLTGKQPSVNSVARIVKVSLMNAPVNALSHGLIDAYMGTIEMLESDDSCRGMRVDVGDSNLGSCDSKGGSIPTELGSIFF